MYAIVSIKYGTKYIIISHVVAIHTFILLDKCMSLFDAATSNPNVSDAVSKN